MRTVSGKEMIREVCTILDISAMGGGAVLITEGNGGRLPLADGTAVCRARAAVSVSSRDMAELTDRLDIISAAAAGHSAGEGVMRITPASPVTVSDRDSDGSIRARRDFTVIWLERDGEG